MADELNLKLGLSLRVFSQVPGEDFTKTFSSVAKFTTLYVFLALSAYLNFEIY